MRKKEYVIQSAVLQNYIDFDFVPRFWESFWEI